MITPPKDILNQINVLLIDISSNRVDNTENIRHTLLEAKKEIAYLRHHITTMSSVRPTSTEMSILQDKGLELGKLWQGEFYSPPSPPSP